MWPHQPIEVVDATIQAALYDLGPYPAITEGTDTISGELWRFQDEDVDKTLEVLDEIEWYQQDGNDLYIRQVVECKQSRGTTDLAYAYFYANQTELSSANRVKADVDGLCRWPG